MQTDDLDYDLPQHLIATEPAQPRDAARLMLINRRSGRVEHRHVRDLPAIIREHQQASSAFGPGDLWVYNQSRVLPAAFQAVRVATGGRVGGLYLNGQDHSAGWCWQVMLESGGKLREGERLGLEGESGLELIESQAGGLWLAKLNSPDDTVTLLNRIGSPPLPPYIRRLRRLHSQPEVGPEDSDRYNTVYADQPGSVAAPTAGLHFTPALLGQLDQVGISRAMVTLHVGLGTFAPVRTACLEDHPVHREWFSVPQDTIDKIAHAQRCGRRIVPVGTTTVRALESLPEQLPQTGGFEAHTELLIAPMLVNAGGGGSEGSVPTKGSNAHGFSFRFTDALLTNFHLPRSTLLALVAALPGVGLDRLKGWYQLAMDHGYRFYSYGDAMLLV